MPRKAGSARKRRSLDDNTARVLNAFRALVKAARSADRATMQKHGVGSAQIFVLHSLEANQPLSVNELAELIATDQSTVSIIVTKLVARGLLERTRSMSDGRRVELTLTVKGKKLARKVPLAFQQTFVTALEEQTPARRRTLARLLTEVVEEMGISEEYPPMLFSDHRPGRKKPGP